MAEEKMDKTPAKATGKAIEAAMIARLFKDSLDSENPIVAKFVWDRDDGQRIDLGRLRPHPSFPSREVASKRLGEKMAQWLSGEKSGPDKNAVLRLETEGSVVFDFSMESFEKAALADDGILVIGVGAAPGVTREPMSIARIARLRLFADDDAPVGRRQALAPIKELIHSEQQEREAQAKRLRNEERRIDAGDFDHVSPSGDEGSEQKGSAPATAAGMGGLRRVAPVTEIVRPSPSGEPGQMEKQMMQVALAQVSRNMGASLKEAPGSPTARPPEGSDPVVERIYAGAASDGPSAIPADSAAAASANSERVDQNEKAVPESPQIRAPSRLPAVIPEPAAKKMLSQVKVERDPAIIDPAFAKSAFPELPGGTDEIHLTIDREALALALAALAGREDFELRIASKGAKLFSLGVCVPAGQIPQLSDFVAEFAKGGVMIRRSPPKA